VTPSHSGAADAPPPARHTSRPDESGGRALVFAGEEEFLAGAVPFLRSALAAGSVALAVVPPRRVGALERALGTDATAVQFVDAFAWYRHPVRTLAAYDELVRSHAPRRIYALTEPFCRDWPALEAVEWIRYEAIVNAAFDGTGAGALCAYDRHAVPPELIVKARHTHPEIVEGGRLGASPCYTDPRRISAECDRGPLPLPRRFDSMAIDSPDLHRVRCFVTERATRYGLPDGELSGLLVAVTEVATNAVKHGTPPMAVRMWTENGDLICEVADCGLWRPGGLLGFLPPAAGAGFGLWGARMLADLVQVRTTWDGTVVRLRRKL
jgi:anti-sigma regulatory factor (Ser/Thr protein kinase)